MPSAFSTLPTIRLLLLGQDRDGTPQASATKIRSPIGGRASTQLAEDTSVTRTSTTHTTTPPPGPRSGRTLIYPHYDSSSGPGSGRDFTAPPTCDQHRDGSFRLLDYIGLFDSLTLPSLATKLPTGLRQPSCFQAALLTTLPLHYD